MALLFLLAPHPALADAGIPMIGLFWPAAWLLLVPVVVIEAYVGMRKCGWDFKRALKIAFVTNFFSTLLGIPLAWIIAFAFELGITALFLNVLKIHPRDPGALVQALTYLVTAPWLAPLERSVYVTPYYAGAALVMCVPFFFSSYYVEYWAGKKYFKAEDPGRLKGWCWSANLASYSCIVLLLAGLIVGSLHANRNQAWLPGDSQAFKSPNSKYVLVSTRLAPNETFPEWALDLKDLANHQSTPVTYIRSGRAFACWSPGGDKFFLNLEQWGQTPPKVCLLYFYVPPLGRINLSEEAVRQNLFDPKLWKRPYESYFVRGDKWLDNDRVQLTVEAWYTAHPKADETRSLSDSFSYVYEIGKGFTFLK